MIVGGAPKAATAARKPSGSKAKRSYTEFLKPVLGREAPG
jgi:hypothetical protein